MFLRMRNCEDSVIVFVSYASLLTMSIWAGIIRAVALQQIDHAPHAKASAERDNKGL